jgi:hypothetical protein
MFRRHLIPAVQATAMVVGVGSIAGAVYAGSDDSAKELAAVRNARTDKKAATDPLLGGVWAVARPSGRWRAALAP